VLIQQIRQAKEIIKKVKLNYTLTPHYATIKKTGKKYITKYTLDSKDIALIVLNQANGQMSTIVGKQTGKDFVFADKNVKVDNVGFNGVNTKLAVSQPAGGIVLALKYLIAKTESGAKKTIVNGLSEAIYTPYNANLDQTGVADFGANYLDNLVDQASQDLSSFVSQFRLDQSISQAIDESWVKAILYAEHLDAQEFLASTDLTGLTRQVNILLATNEGQTWNFSKSSAGALGIAQFMPNTYALLVKKYPKVKLIEDFEQGMRNHLNAIKATYLLLDDYLALIKKNLGENFVDSQTPFYAAAGYNGGATRVINAVKYYGEQWSANHLSDLAATKQAVSDQNTQISVLKKKISKTKIAKDKKTLNVQLATAKNNLSKLNSNYTQINKATLRQETLIYLQKVEKLIGLGF
jgi:hypothetical protein